MEDCRPNATAAEMMEFVWLDPNGSEAPAAKVIVEILEKAAAAAGAEESSA
jgi:hypothetical protein